MAFRLSEIAILKNVVIFEQSEQNSCNKHTNLCSRHTNLCSRHTNSCGRHTNSCSRHTNSCSRHTNLCSRHTNSCSRHTNSCSRHTNLCSRHTNSTIFQEKICGGGEGYGRKLSPPFLNPKYAPPTHSPSHSHCLLQSYLISVLFISFLLLLYMIRPGVKGGYPPPPPPPPLNRAITNHTPLKCLWFTKMNSLYITCVYFS